MPRDQNQTKNGKKKWIIAICITLFITTTGFLLYIKPWSNDLPKIYHEIDFATENSHADYGSIYTTSQGLIVLDINGTYEQMGYAHGILLGDYIKYTVEYVINSELINGDIEKYNTLVDETLPEYLAINETMHSIEFEAIVQGAEDSDADMFIDSLNRDWEEKDLYALNAIQDWYQSYCSAVGIWGDFSETGNPILGRNMDFSIDAKGYLSQLYMLHIYRGNSERNDVISFSFPGMISVYSGFNSQGVWISTDSSNGTPIYQKNRTMITMSMRNFLEQEDGTNVANDAKNFFLSQNPTQSFLLFVASNENVMNPIFVLEGNDKDVIVRNGSKANDESIILTNHERILQEPVDCTRYAKYLETLEGFIDFGDNKVDGTEIKKMVQDSGYEYSINTIIFQPASLEFQFGCSRIDSENNTKWTDTDVTGGPWDTSLDHVYQFEDF